ncbi:hypothetical protein URH17368_0732 [Alicyclobacillus hesperidum URH17-3-68]|uniref:two-component system regulatory protein YycI n=1 Tax=Alicyclobacillus hesperidum TaxID=89784 RepID=UPI000281AD6A|nr:two-component system regulatory protein YycI [Alicyclobacillus hesperidum]EJY56767.1 hypothetical protein URH17368_0732 [Alicyclobacillus hesperidum URH17-3-68]GLG01877.1 hypothetical protein Alches_19180 [Alicyclobacillus hesperidum subsp. aegles]
MNWEVAKSWLIALFIVLDAVLGWQLYESRQLASDYAESPADLLANTKTLLANHGFSLDTQVPSGQPNLVTFQADLANPKLSALVQAAFPNVKGKLTYTGNVGVTTNQGSITVTAQGNWTVEYQSPMQITTTHTVLSYVYRGSEYTPDPISSDPNHAVYYEMVDNYPIFDAAIVSTESKGLLVAYSQTLVEHVVANSSPKPVISALDALDSLADAVDKTDTATSSTVVRVDLGYARKVQVASGNQQVLQSYWFPVWRIVTTAGTYYVNAFTGEVEMATAF